MPPLHLDRGDDQPARRSRSRRVRSKHRTSRLTANLAIAAIIEEQTSGDPKARARAALAAFDGKLEGYQDEVVNEEERGRREGWLVKGMRAFGDD